MRTDSHVKDTLRNSLTNQYKSKTYSARANLTRFDRAQLDHELMIAIIGETTDDGEWTENGTVEDVR